MDSTAWNNRGMRYEVEAGLNVIYVMHEGREHRYEETAELDSEGHAIYQYTGISGI